MGMTESEFDFIVVGSGSAGGVLANRLSEDPSNSVLVLEYGGRDSSVIIQMPSACFLPMKSKRFDWGFMTESEPGLNGRRIHQARGKVIGGTSSINGMCYVRGHPGDFDQWEEMGAVGWSYSDCLPYFRRAEDCRYGADTYRGESGPITICNGNNMENPLYHAFIDAGVEAGYLRSGDVNGYQQDGFGRMDLSIKDGVRSSTASAYLKPAMSRPNLAVRMHALGHRVLIQDNRAVGVEYTMGNKVLRATARREVILCAGPINSPKLLMLSGIGNARHLGEHGIEPIHHLPGVGENLQDHLGVSLHFDCTQPITLNGRLGLFSKAMIGLRWLLFRDGLGASCHYEANGYVRSEPSIPFPDIQYHFMAAALVFGGTSVYKGHGFHVFMSHGKPLSRGTVRLRSNEPKDPPKLLFNYLDDENDKRAMRNGAKLTREIIAQPAFDPFRGPEIRPGADVSNDDDLDAWIAENAGTSYHPCGTCRMGSDEGAVVDPQTRVHGLLGLRVVDSSVMPFITNANLNAPTIMIGEKAADLILGNEPLPPSNAPGFFAEGWKQTQRTGTPKRGHVL